MKFLSVAEAYSVLGRQESNKKMGKQRIPFSNPYFFFKLVYNTSEKDLCLKYLNVAIIVLLCKNTFNTNRETRKA